MPEQERERFEAIVGTFTDLRKKSWPWLLLVVVPLAWSFLAPTMQRFHELKWAEEPGTGHVLGFGGLWCRFVARPLFALFVGLWFWRLILLFVFPACGAADGGGGGDPDADPRNPAQAGGSVVLMGDLHSGETKASVAGG